MYFNQDLVSRNVTTDEQRNEAASDLVILTSDSSSLTSDELEDSVVIVETIVSDAEELDQNVRMSLIQCAFIIFMIQMSIDLCPASTSNQRQTAPRL